MDPIPTTPKTNKIKLKCGAQAVVRRVRRSISNQLMATITAGTHEAIGEMHAQLVVRAAICGVEAGPAGEVLKLDDQVVEYRSERMPGQRIELAHVDIYDALNAFDVVNIYLAALSVVSEEQKGN